MSRWRLWARRSFGLVLWALAAVAAAQTAPLVPLEAFFAPPRLQDAELSPTGRWMAAQTSVPDRRIGLMIFDMEGKEAPRFIEVSPKDNVDWFSWVSDEWLVFSVVSPADRSPYRPGRGLLSVRRDGTGVRLLIAREYEDTATYAKRRYLDYKHYFLALGAPGTNEVIVGQANYDDRYEYQDTTPKVLNVSTGAVRGLLDGGPKADSWWFDARGHARAASMTQKGVSTTWWADKAGAWTEINKAPVYEQPYTVRYIDGDDQLFVRTTDAGGSMSLRRFDFATKKPSAEALIATPGFNSTFAVRRERDTGEVLGLTLLTDASTPVWFSPAMKNLQAKVDAKFPDNINLLWCSPCRDAKTVLVYTYSDRDPGSYVLWRVGENKWQLLGETRPDIDPRRMAALEFHRTKARDGEDLPVWVTRPRQAAGAAAKPAPAVVLVHGGPFVRGTSWRWDDEAQFLASRGYVVIEPEFRGSRGYGESHHRAGWKQWGRAMQDDVTDALRFAVAQGWADASRACIMGSSYGGYSALMGLIKDPDLYRCGVAHAAVSDLRNLYDFHWSDQSTEGRDYDLPLLVGDKVKDAAILAAGSAVAQASKIKAPLLLVHGGLDLRVPVQHAEGMLEALRKQGKDVEWVPYPDEGHGFFFDESRYDYYRRVEAFLAKHLK